MKHTTGLVAVCLKQCYKCRIFKKKYPKLPCIYLDNPIEGWGDVISFITFYLHIPHCSGCERRRIWMNRYLWWPFKVKKPIDHLSVRLALRKLKVRKFPVVFTKDLKKIIRL